MNDYEIDILFILFIYITFKYIYRNKLNFKTLNKYKFIDF